MMFTVRRSERTRERETYRPDRGQFGIAYIIVVDKDLDIEIPGMGELARLDPDAELAFHCVRIVL